VNVRLCIPKIAILPAHGHCYSTRSGGRKPPVENLSPRYSVTHICNSIRTCNQERGASAPVVRALVMREKRNHPAIDDTRCKHGFRNHGGLTPAALVSTVVIPRTLFAVHFQRDPMRPTAGSRPPLLIPGPIFAG
jgi:hypothetical protein